MQSELLEVCKINVQISDDWISIRLELEEVVYILKPNMKFLEI